MNNEIKELPTRDLDAAKKAVGGNAGLAQELFTSFLEDLEPHLQEIRQRHQAADWAELKNSTHRLHGGAAYCGVPALKAALRNLEQTAREGEPAEIGRCIEALEHESKRLLATAAR